MSSGFEKREANRVPLDAVVHYAPEGEDWRESKSKDISNTGMLLATDEALDPGRILQLSFNLPNMKWQDPIQAEAEVVRVINRQGRQLGVGLRFITLKSRHYEAVEEFVGRVMGIAVGESQFEGLGRKDSKGSYVFSMDRLASEASNLKAAAEEKKLNAMQARERWDKITRVLSLTGRGTLLIGGFYIFYKGAGFLMKIITKLSELSQ